MNLLLHFYDEGAGLVAVSFVDRTRLLAIQVASRFYKYNHLCYKR